MSTTVLAASELRATQHAECRPERMVAWLILVDLLSLFLSGLVALTAKHLIAGTHDFTPYLGMLRLGILFPVVYGALGLYSGIPLDSTEELRRLTFASVMVCLCLGLLTLSYRGNGVIFTWTMSIALLVSIVLVPVARVVLRFRLSKKNWWGYPTLVFGAGTAAEGIVRMLLANPSLGLKPFAYVRSPDECSPYESLLLPSIDAGAIASATPGSRRSLYAVVPGSGRNSDHFSELIEKHRRSFSHVLVVPDVWEFSCLWVTPKNLGGMLGLEVREQALLPHNRWLKRSMDLILIAACAPLLVLLVLGLAALISADSYGPVFYRHRRIGRDGSEFRAWKFRTMRADAEAMLEPLLAADEELRKEWDRTQKLKKDPRVTKVGSWLRSSSLDELPQLWNVLRGEMSLVGPRPIVREEIPRYGPGFDVYSRVPSGLTGLWQVSGRSDTTYAQRVGFDVFYVRNWSIWLDLCILFRTIGVVLSRAGAH